ncbi:MAG: bifunctional transcriptional activator/DNA repair enzyme AdaA, partial [Terriglobales bacterium]
MQPLAQTNVSTTDTDPRWRVVLARDRRADGAFVFSVTTTGVYCHPSCAARRPRPEHVQFYPSAAAAQSAGFRPCRRCHPDLPPPWAAEAAGIAAACRGLAGAEPPPLAVLAREAGVSPFHFHRRFKVATGLTPHQYAAAHRDRRLRQALPAAASVTEAIYAAGYNSSGRFYASSGQVLGMTPTRFRTGGQGEEIRYT